MQVDLPREHPSLLAASQPRIPEYQARRESGPVILDFDRYPLTSTHFAMPNVLLTPASHFPSRRLPRLPGLAPTWGFVYYSSMR